MPRLTDPDRLAAYLDALSNWAVEGYVLFKLTEPSQRWIEQNLERLRHKEIKRLMWEYVVSDGEIDEVRETNKDWKKLHDFHYDFRFAIQGIPVYIETRLIWSPFKRDDDPTIEVVSIHAP